MITYKYRVGKITSFYNKTKLKMNDLMQDYYYFRITLKITNSFFEFLISKMQFYLKLFRLGYCNANHNYKTDLKIKNQEMNSTL
jgi:hypothetical protein